MTKVRGETEKLNIKLGEGIWVEGDMREGKRGDKFAQDLLFYCNFR